MLLSSLDCTVIQHGAEFNLGLHKYQGNTFSPNGHKYIREFDASLVPTTTYRVGGVVLKKEVIFQAYEDRILIRYTLVDAHSATTLRFRPFLAFRSVRQFTHENATASREYSTVDGGIRTCMYAGYPDLYMQFSKKNEFVFQPDWYRGIEYPKEQERGYASNEDLYVPGYFEMPIKKGESIIFSGSTSQIKASSLKKLFEDEVGLRAPRDNFYHCLVTAAHQFHFRDRRSGKSAQIDENDDRQLWKFVPTAGNYCIENKQSNLAWNNSGGFVANGNSIITWTNDANNAVKPTRQWYLVEGDTVDGIAMSEADADADYRITYNPEAESVQIRIPSDATNRQGEIRLYDIQGKELGVGSTEQPISMTGMPKGIYLLRWIVQGHSRSLKFTKP